MTRSATKATPPQLAAAPSASDHSQAIHRQAVITPTDLGIAIAQLTAACPKLAQAVAAHGPPELRREPAGFRGLAHIVVGQQVSVASAAAIWARFEAEVHPLDAAGYLALSEAGLARIGLSGPKKRTLARLCTAMTAGDFEPATLELLPDAEAAACIMALSGFGPWSADIYLMFCLGRADAFAAGDLALQVAAQSLFELPARPDAAGLLALAERWRPWRAAAALILWRTYRFTRQARSGAPL